MLRVFKNKKFNKLIKVIKNIFMVIGIIVTLYSFYTIIANNFLKPNYEELAIDNLRVDGNYSSIVEIIGESNYKEEQFIDKINKNFNVYHYDYENSYISYYVNDNDIILAYNLIQKNKKLDIPIPLPLARSESVYLGEVYLSDLLPSPIYVDVLNSLRDYYYTEVHGTGSWGNYNYYIASKIDIGFNTDSHESIANLYIDSINGFDFINSPNLEDYRQNIKPNSFGVIKNNIDDEFIEYIISRQIGPNKYLLNNF